MPEDLLGQSVNGKVPVGGISTSGGSSSFGQRREDIYRRLQQAAEQCKLNYSGRKELASEKDDAVAELCEALDESFSYGLRQQQVTAISIFQNMHEIVTGASSNGTAGDTTFWDFCQTHLTVHERERYENLKHVWTNHGRGKAFVRATLNEHSLQRYLLTWLSAEELLHLYYTPWSLMLHIEMGKGIADIVGSLNGILFALNVDATELNVATRYQPTVPTREEPIIYVPTPLPVSNGKSKRRANAVERPITSSNSTEDLLSALQETPPQAAQLVDAVLEYNMYMPPQADETPCDPIEPELAFLKQPLPVGNHSAIGALNNGHSPSVTVMSAAAEAEYDEYKSDSSSQYSKSSSVNVSTQANQTALENKLQDMTERCALLETRVAQLSLENRQLVRRLKQHFHESGIDPSSSLASNFLITIPHVKLLKSHRGSSYHAYEIHITMRQHLEHWVLMRRYREFYKLHKSLLRTHPSIAASVEFPPKKHFGNMNMVFVEERRQQLQIYLLNLVESLPQVEACKSKAELQKVFPFLRER